MVSLVFFISTSESAFLDVQYEIVWLLKTFFFTFVWFLIISYHQANSDLQNFFSPLFGTFNMNWITFQGYYQYKYFCQKSADPKYAPARTTEIFPLPVLHRASLNLTSLDDASPRMMRPLGWCVPICLASSWGTPDPYIFLLFFVHSVPGDVSFDFYPIVFLCPSPTKRWGRFVTNQPVGYITPFFSRKTKLRDASSVKVYAEPNQPQNRIFI
jgi:hypothetical protein